MSHYQVKEYIEKIKYLSKEKIVYVDETGIGKFLYRKYARALRGEKVYERVRGNKFERTSIVAAQVGSRIIAPLQYKGMMHSQFFEEWFEKHLIQELAKEAVVVMDNEWIMLLFIVRNVFMNWRNNIVSE